MTQAAASASIVVPPRACGHHSHRGWCGCCQRTQKVRWEAQLAQVSTPAAPAIGVSVACEGRVTPLAA
jgi:hypothetical protein